ncbi:MAG: hypothetical protein ACK492_08045 [Chitinophagaceae bacterium]|jgi:hypothetical protein
MKRITTLILAIATVSLLGSCVKNELPVFTAPVAEFDAASWNANAAGLSFPILTRVPGYGRAASTADPLLTRTSPGIKKFRVNLVGQQMPTETEVYVIMNSVTSTAVAGTHYRSFTPVVKIPANTSFGEVEVDILNPGVAGAARTLELILSSGTNGIKSNPNYNRIRLSIAQ